MDNRLDYTKREFANRILRFGQALKAKQAEKIQRSFREASERHEAKKGKEPFRDDSLEPWELLADESSLHYKPTNRDTADLKERLVEATLTNLINGERLEKMNVVEINHP